MRNRLEQSEERKGKAASFRVLRALASLSLPPPFRYGFFSTMSGAPLSLSPWYVASTVFFVGLKR